METTYNPSLAGQRMIVVTEDGLAEIIRSLLPSMIHEGIKNFKEEELKDKLYTPNESRQLLGGISRPTLDSLAEAGTITKIYVGGRVFYKHSDITNAMKTFKRYSRRPIHD